MVRIHLLPPSRIWGYNSVGRVAALQAVCRRFESDYLHQSPAGASRTSEKGVFTKTSFFVFLSCLLLGCCLAIAFQRADTVGVTVFASVSWLAIGFERGWLSPNANCKKSDVATTPRSAATPRSAFFAVDRFTASASLRGEAEAIHPRPAHAPTQADKK